MLWDVILCTLLSLGILLLLWCVTGVVLLPLPRRQTILLEPERKDGWQLERQLRSFLWLRAAGLSRGRVYVLTDSLSRQALRELQAFTEQQTGFYCITREELRKRLEMELEHDGSGRTDDPGNGAECAVSEPGERI